MNYYGQSSLALVKPASKNYDKLITAMKTQLDPKPLTIAERLKFH